MNLVLVTPPADEPLTLAQVKTHLRITAELDDAKLQQRLAPARMWAERYTGLQLLSATYELRLPAWPIGGRVALCSFPVRGVTVVTYLDQTGTAKTLPPNGYELVEESGSALIVFTDPTSLPELTTSSRAVAIRFTAGYGDDPSCIPPLLIDAMLFHVQAHHAGDASTFAVLMEAAEGLLQPFRPLEAW